MPTVAVTPDSFIGINTREMFVAHGRNLDVVEIAYEPLPAGRVAFPADVVLSVEPHTQVYINLREG